jgi:serine/threonine-protein kinase PknG
VTAFAARILAADDSGASAIIPIDLRLPLAEHESLYRFLLKGTAEDPDARFQSADEMSGQLLGILREIVARTRPVPAADSAEFLRERSVAGPMTDPAAARDAAWRRLPDLRIDVEDPAASEIFAAGATSDIAQRMDLLAAAMRNRPASAEARLRLADARIDLGAGDPEQLIPLLDEALAIDPFDWRPDWYCGKLYLSLGRAADAVECFDKVYSEIPGECVPKLALAAALEQDGRRDDAAGLYDTVSRIDPNLTSAAFGLARCRLARGDRDGAVEAYGRVPDGAASWHDAQLAAVRALIDASHAPPTQADLARASDLLARMPRDDIPRYEAEAALALEAARQLESAPAARGKASGLNGAQGKLLDTRLQPAALRRRAEAAFRACARLSENREDRIVYVDRANAARPRTLI